MSNIIRVEHSKNYTVISNDAIRDKRISLKARGLHHLLLSYPDSWKISIGHLSEEASDEDARTAIQSALKELEKFGYLTREQVRDIKGRITGWENVVRELPQAGFPNVDKSTSGKHHNRKNRKRENPNVGNPATENPEAEDQCLINTDLQELSKKEIPIPPTPQGEEGCEENSASLEESGSPTQSPLTEQPCQPSNSSNDNKAYPGNIGSAPARDNSYGVSTEVINAQRAKLESRYRVGGLQGEWLENKDFQAFIARHHLVNTPNWQKADRAPTFRDAKRWIRNQLKEDAEKVYDLWEEYIEEQEKARQNETLKESAKEQEQPQPQVAEAAPPRPNNQFFFHQANIRNLEPTLRRFRSRGIEWAKQQPDVVLVYDNDGEVTDIQELEF